MKLLKDIEKDMLKPMLRVVLPIWIFGIIISTGAIGGLIYFGFWCARKFFGQ